MAFDSSGITLVLAPDPAVRELRARWDSTDPAGTIFQLYINGRRVWTGAARSVGLPWPTAQVTVQVGRVGPGEGATDFGASLPVVGSGPLVALAWLGGRWQGESIAGFHLYRGATAGAAPDMTKSVATVAAYAGGVVRDGAGRGPAGRGGAGRAASRYSYTDGPLGPGIWNYSIVPYDIAGNEGAVATVAATVAAPPPPPVADSNGRRLSHTFDSATRIATLTWTLPT